MPQKLGKVNGQAHNMATTPTKAAASTHSWLLRRPHRQLGRQRVVRCRAWHLQLVRGSNAAPLPAVRLWLQ